ncbi:hypothetical protein BDW62DRAFT_204131 [Aspergillus aurantiobrunneus]
MSSTPSSEKPMRKKQQLKHEMFPNKKAKQAVGLQHSGPPKEKRTKKWDDPISAVELKNWVDETPAGQRKILNPLDDALHKAYIPKVVESAWYSFREEQGLFKPQTESDGSLQKKAFPHGIREIGADALRFSLVGNTQASGSDFNIDATKYVLGKLGDNFTPRESGNLRTGNESLPEKWILTKLNTAAKQINQAHEEREFARSAQIIHRYLYDNLFDIYTENSKVIISDGTAGEARTAMDTLYTSTPRLSLACDSSLRSCPSYLKSFGNAHRADHTTLRPRSQSPSIRGYRSLLVDYAGHGNKTKNMVCVAPLNQTSLDTASAQLPAIKSLLSSKIPVEIRILEAGEPRPIGCAVFTVSADANVYLDVRGRIQYAGKEAEKFRVKVSEARRDRQDIDALKAKLGKVQDKDVAEAMQSAESRKRDVDARLQALEETVAMLEMMMMA